MPGENPSLNTNDPDSERSSFFTHSSDLLCVISFDGIIKSLNPAWFNLLDWFYEDLIGKSVKEFLHVDDISIAADAAATLFSGGDIRDLEARFKNRSGAYIWLSWNAGGNFEKRLIYASARDISEKKRSEDDLLLTSVRLRSILESVTDAFFSLDNNDVITYINGAAEISLGKKRAEVLGKNVYEAFPEFKHGLIEEKLRLSYSRKEALSFETYLTLGRLEGWYQIRVFPGDNGVSVFSQNVTEKKLADEYLFESTRRYRGLFDNSLDAVVMIVMESGKFYFEKNNSIHRTMTGLVFDGNKTPLESVYGKTDAELIISNLRNCVETGRAISYEEMVHLPAGDRIWLTELVPIPGHDGKIDLVASMSRDITKQKEDEERIIIALQEADISREQADRANMAKSEFLANMSHEIRTPMNAIFGFAELLKGRVMDEKSRKYLDGILTGGKNLLSLINDILDLSKLEAGKMEPRLEDCDFIKLLHDFKEIFVIKEIEKGIVFSIDIGGNVPRNLVLDETRMRQILFNVIGNAMKFTDKGAVNVSVKCYFGESHGFTDLSIEVRDTGIGIPEDQREIIFEAFRQQDGQSSRKYGGTGLGLTITKRLVEMMGGMIEIESEVGVGSVFRIVIPGVMVKDGPVIKKLVDSDEIFSGMFFEGKTVLLAEDTESNREIIKGYLENSNLDLIIVENGKEALEKLANQKIDLVLLDMMMPVMSGFEALNIMKADPKLKSIPVVAVTASVVEQQELRARSLCDGYLRKPVSRNELLKMIAKFISPINAVIDGSAHASGLKYDGELSSDEKKNVELTFYKRWEDISVLMSNDDILLFAEDLKNYSNKKGLPELLDYSNDLIKYTRIFDIERMNLLFNSFPDIIGAAEGAGDRR